jgi:hypothetical protein
MNENETLSAYWKRFNSAIRVDSMWQRAVIGGISGLSGALLSTMITDSFAARLIVIFFLTLLFAVILSTLANRLV